MNKYILRLIFLALTTLLSCWSVSAHSASSMEDLQSEYETLKQEYTKRKNDGYDLTHIDPLLDKLRIARSKKDHLAFHKALDDIGLALQELKIPQVSSYVADRDTITFESTTRIEDFAFGIEYAQPRHASLFQSLGINWIRMGPIIWGIHEPQPPIGDNHTYNWKKIDERVREYQNAGFVNVQFVVSAKSPWASHSLSDKSPESATPPKEKHWKDYQTFISRLVERYDGDGIDDMPGIKRLTIYLLVESEAYHKGFWNGTVEEYGKLLETVYKGAKQANQQTKIMLAGINFADLLDDLPAYSQVPPRIKKLPKGFRDKIDFMRTSLSYKDYFDVVELHYNYDFRGLFGTVEWIRGEMTKNGYSKPIWAGDAGVAPMLHGAYVKKHDGKKNIRMLGNSESPGHDDFNRWYRAEQARSLVKKIIVAMEVGLQGINIGNMIDWKGYWGGENWWYQGLLDKEKRPRPAFYTYKLMVEKIGTSTTISRLMMDEGIFAYRLERPSGNIFVLWSESGEKPIRLPISGKYGVLSHTVTTPGTETSTNEKIKVDDGVVEFRLTSTPVFLEDTQ